VIETQPFQNDLKVAEFVAQHDIKKQRLGFRGSADIEVKIT